MLKPTDSNKIRQKLRLSLGCAAPYTATKAQLNRSVFDRTLNLTAKSPMTMLRTSNESHLTPSKIPPDLPHGGRQCQSKSIPPDKVLRNCGEKFALPVSDKAIKSNLCSIDASARNLLLAKSLRPLLFQKIPFISHHGIF